MEKDDDIIALLSVFDAVRKQIVLPDTYKITFFVKWICLHCIIAVFKLHSQSCLPIPEFSGYHCTYCISLTKD